MKILLTGAAGFIGFHLSEKLLLMGHIIIGIDNLNDYYDVNLKYERLNHCGINYKNILDKNRNKSTKYANYIFMKLDLNDKKELFNLFSEEQFDVVINLAAQAGVRYSIENPYTYIDSNISGFLNILEACRANNIQHLIYASSSSVYGMNKKTPFSIEDRTDHPISLYAATKKANELMAYTYSHLYNLPSTGLRFFTVYGPWGRPDMAYYKFAQSIMNDQPIQIYNNGDMLRDFTYIEDIIDGIIASMNKIPCVPSLHIIYNLGNNRPVKLINFIEILENSLGKKAIKKYLGMQAGDVQITMADIDSTRNDLGWQPKTEITEGLAKFTQWFLEYSKVKHE